MRSFIGFVVICVVVLSWTVAPAAAGDKKCDPTKCKGKCCEKKADDIIYDLAVPWPFHRHAEVVVVPDTDTDGDGVFDKMDKCPDTPKGAAVDKNGCPLDSDGDGVFDGIDECPDTPKGAKVNARGCPSDADGDGVFDGIDRCPNTPADLEVDEKGCPVEVSEIETQLLDTGKITSSNILFESAKADLKPESYAVLDEIGNTLVQWPDLKIEIGGHTDSQGTEDFNQTLSAKRSASVRDYIVGKFDKVNPDNLTVAGYGENKPIATNDTDTGRAQNRRVEFTVLNKETLKKEIERRTKKTK